MRIGAHLSISGGHATALQKIADIGGNCLQIFSTSPRSWQSAKVTDDQIKLFLQEKDRLKIDPVYFHASYLINLADTGQIAKESMQSLIAEMNLASKLKVKGSVIHLGSYRENGTTEPPVEGINKRYEILISNITHVLAQTPSDVLFIIENAGTQKIGLTIDEIAKIISDVNDDRLRVCFDTCHLHAGGYKLSTAEELDRFLKTFDSFVGISKLELWHLNDSKDPFASRRDRHENIGTGTIGMETFRLLLNNPIANKKPFILEVPGIDDKGPDKQNVDVVKSLIEK